MDRLDQGMIMFARRSALRTVIATIAFGTMLSLTACGGGGGGGGGGGSSSSGGTSGTTTVSGSIQAPNGQVAFYAPHGWGERWQRFFLSTAYASISGLSAVPDGTQVQLVRLNADGIGFNVLATTTATAGRYTFDLTSLNAPFASNLVIRVLGPGGKEMRGFAGRSTVDVDPASELAVRLVLEQIAANPGSTLSRFTVKEVNDLTAAVQLLARAKQFIGGPTLDPTIATIRNVFNADPQLMAFLASIAADGQAADGPGDVGNYFPLDQGNVWTFQGMYSETGQPPINYQNVVSITGTKPIGGVIATTIAETNSDGSGQGEEDYVTEESNGITFQGSNDASDILTPQLVPYRQIQFPLYAGATFQQVNRNGLNLGQDLNGDGQPEQVNVVSQVTVVGFESVTVPAGTFPESAKIETQITATAILSQTGGTATVTGTETIWFAPGVGPVKSLRVTQGQGLTETVSEELTAYTIGLNMRVITLASNDLVYDPGTGRIYASVPAGGGANANTVTAIDPNNAQVGASVPVGDSPNKLARSDNGDFLYVALDGPAAVRRIDLTTFTAGLQFAVGVKPDPVTPTPLFVEDMEVLPGDSHAVAISRRNQGFSPRHEGVAIYDDGVQRPTATPGHTGSNVIEFGATLATLYGHNTETTEFGFRRMAVDSMGVTVTAVNTSFDSPSLLPDSSDIRYDAGRIYSTSGRVIDPEAFTLIGTFPGIASFGWLVRPDAAQGKVYFLQANGMGATLRIHDLNTFVLLKAIQLPGISGTPGSLIRWGSDGLAFRTSDNQVVLVNISDNLQTGP
jgi:hypothetical protein